ncbi:MAG TPA: sugar phosphate isomerase/epimerase family protein, partial [Polyangiaceae bacterium]|nr:sugar phosphate isomerase/epimerase family protein [Polyangiaceae bacterium]
MSNAPDTAPSQTVHSLPSRQPSSSAAPSSLRRAPQPAALECRRSFLKQALAAPAFALGLAGSAAPVASGAPGDTSASGGRAPGDERETAKAQPFKISLTQWSLRRELQAGRLAPLDFVKAANGFGIDAVEYVSQFYPGKPGDKAVLAELKRRAAGEGVASLLIRIEAGGNLGAPDARGRQRAVDGYKRWVEAAAFLGCHSIRVPTAGSGSEDDQANWLSEGLRRLCEFSAPHGIDVLVENQGGLSSKGSWLSEVL